MRRLVAAVVALLPVALLAPGVGATPSAGGGDKWALVVVINRYKPPTKVAGGSRDADHVREALLRNGWPDDHIRVLTEEAATAANMRAGMDWLAQNAGDSSFSVMHYSGHVKQKRGDVDRDGEAIDEFLWSWDNQFLSDAELGQRMRAVRGAKWVDVSGCEAAGFDDGISGPRSLFTGSSQETQNSYSMVDGSSIFTGLMVRDGLLGGVGDADGNGTVSLHEAFDHALREAPGMTANMSNGPQTPYLAGGDGAQWFLQPPASPKAAATRTIAGIPVPAPVPELPVPLPADPPVPLPPIPQLPVPT